MATAILTSGQGTWNKLEVPVTCSLNSLFFTDSLYGWVAGDSGTIIHTTDGGVSWSIQESNTTNDIVEIFFLDRQRGWASSFNFTSPPFGTLLLSTVNGGLSWVPEPYPEEDLFITCILYRDSLNGWMGGKPHALVKTNDGGTTWTHAAVDTSTLAFFPVLDITFWDTQYGYACGGIFDVAGVVWRTNNGGDLWYAMDVAYAPADEVHALYLFDSITVMGAGGDPDFGYGVGMIRSSDGGISWTYDELDIQGYASDLGFRTPSECWSPLGTRRMLIRSQDTGKTWTAVPTPDSTSVFRLVFTDSLHGYAAGRDGAVLKYMPKPGLGAPENPDLCECGMTNYPNPFSHDTEIRFTLNAGARVVITVYNMMGQVIETLADEEMTAGDHHLHFDAARLQSGIYLARMTTEHGDVSVRKLILLN